MKLIIDTLGVCVYRIMERIFLEYKLEIYHFYARLESLKTKIQNECNISEEYS